MLEIQDLTIKTREVLLSDFNTNFEQGNLYGLVATNGSGKTTLFRAMSGLIKITRGTIKIEKSHSLFYFETNEWLDKNLTGYDYLTFFRKEYKSSISEKEVISFWNMIDYIHLPIKKYSLGMKQRLLISLYQITNADIMLMDEITNGLDEESREKLFYLLYKFRSANKIVILSSHYKEDILPYCDYLMTLKNKNMEINKL